MNTAENHIRVLALLCDAQGLIRRILVDDLGISARIQPGRVWTALVDPSSLSKALTFWQALQKQQAISAWELTVPFSEGVLPLQFSAGMTGDLVMLVAATPPPFESALFDEELACIASAQANQVRSLLKEQAAHPPPDSPAFYDEMARLNNELVNLQRELARKNTDLQEKQRLLEQIFNVIPNAIYLLDLERQEIVQANPSLPLLLGLEVGELPRLGAEQWMDMLHPQDRQEYAAYLRRRSALAAGEMIDHEHRIVRPDGRVVWLHSREVVFAAGADGRATQILGASYDVTQSRQTQERLLQMSYTDSLTGLGNRAFIDAEMQRLETVAAEPVSVLVADLNDLKAVNDRLGHAAGDEMLRQAALVLQSALRAGEAIARTGGDEFVVLLPRTTRATVQRIVRRIRRDLVEYNAAHPDAIPLSLAIGIATARPGESLSTTLQVADRRMYHNKARHKAAAQDG